MKTTRRDALLGLAGAVTVSSFPILGQNPPPENRHGHYPITKQDEKQYQFVFFRPEQMDTLEALTETIIPADGHSPGARAARVAEYIDAIVADSPDSTKKAWSAGLSAVDGMAKASYGQTYGRCTATQQIDLMERIAAAEEKPHTPEEHFFVALKRATIDGYYTSRIGIHEDLEYQGNVAVASYADCTHGGAER